MIFKSSERYQKAARALACHRYDPYYQMVFCFMARLAQAAGEKESVCFWEAFNDQPRDLFGRGEIEWVVRLLAEAEHKEAWLPCQARMAKEVEAFINMSFRAQQQVPGRLFVSVLENAPLKIAGNAFFEAVTCLREAKGGEDALSGAGLALEALAPRVVLGELFFLLLEDNVSVKEIWHAVASHPSFFIKVLENAMKYRYEKTLAALIKPAERKGLILTCLMQENAFFVRQGRRHFHLPLSGAPAKNLVFLCNF